MSKTKLFTIFFGSDIINAMVHVYLKVLLIMAVLFAFMLPGFALKKLKLFGEGATVTLSNLLLYVCQPALAINSFCVFSEEDYAVVQAIKKTVFLKNFAITAAISFAAMGIMFALCKLVFLRYKRKDAANVYTYIAVFSNCGFLGIPFVEAFTDGNPVAVMYMMVFNVVFSIMCWTFGVALITGSVKNIRLKKVLLNPTVISNVVALALFFVPQINIFMLDGAEQLRMLPQYLSYMTAPLSMIIVGVRVAEMDFKSIFGDKGSYFAGFLRLAVAPFLTLALALPFRGVLGAGAASGFEEFVYISPVIAMAMSPAASVLAMAESFGGDTRTAASGFVSGTVLSLVTIPLVITAVAAIFGISA